MNEREGLIYVPKFIQINSDYNYGDVVTHEQYTELLNLNQTQGDYNTEVLRKMFTSNDSEDTYHIPYLDTAIDGIDERLTTVEGEINPIIEDITRLDTVVEELNETVEGHTESIDTILDILHTSVDHAEHANIADKVAGVDEAENMSYYGTNVDGDVGFHVFPDLVSYDDYSGVAINSVYIVPKLSSVNENMLTPEVRTKLNREGVTSYEALSDLPFINGVELIGSLNLGELGIQPAGNYLTEVPDTYSTTAEMEEYVAGELVPYLTSAEAAATYRTEDQVSSAITEALNLYATADWVEEHYLRKTTAASTYNRIGVNSYPSNPRIGDLRVNV